MKTLRIHMLFRILSGISIGSLYVIALEELFNRSKPYGFIEKYPYVLIIATVLIFISIIGMWLTGRKLDRMIK